MSNVYGMCVLVLLLAYGLAFVPITLWKATDTERKLYDHLFEAQQVWQEFRDARLDYMKEVSICHDLANYRTEENTKFIDLLLSELP